MTQLFNTISYNTLVKTGLWQNSKRKKCKLPLKLRDNASHNNFMFFFCWLHHRGLPHIFQVLGGCYRFVKHGKENPSFSSTFFFSHTIIIIVIIMINTTNNNSNNHNNNILCIYAYVCICIYIYIYRYIDIHTLNIYIYIYI